MSKLIRDSQTLALGAMAAKAVAKNPGFMNWLLISLFLICKFWGAFECWKDEEAILAQKLEAFVVNSCRGILHGPLLTLGE